MNRHGAHEPLFRRAEDQRKAGRRGFSGGFDGGVRARIVEALDGGAHIGETQWGTRLQVDYAKQIGLYQGLHRRIELIWAMGLPS